MVRFAHIAWGVLIALCALAFVWSGAWPLLAVCVALVAVPAAGIVLAGLAVRKVELTFTSPTTVQKGTPATCDLSVTNNSRFPFARIEVGLVVNNLLTAQHEDVTVRVSAGPGETVTAPFTFTSAVCGRIALTVERVSAYEPFGLFRRTKRIESERRLSVMPALHEARLRSIYAASPLADTTIFSPYLKGPDASEVFGLREYEQGDDLRRIHWKLSSKRDELVVREASLPLDNSLLVFWDKSVAQRVGSGGAQGALVEDPLRADALAEVLLGVCEELCHGGIEYEVAFNEVARERCFSEHVSDENDIYELIGHAMSHPLAVSGTSGLTSYLREYGRFSCSRIIYVGTQLPPELDSLRRSCSVIAFVCDDTTDVVAEAGYAEVHFPAGEAALALSMAGVI